MASQIHYEFGFSPIAEKTPQHIQKLIPPLINFVYEFAADERDDNILHIKQHISDAYLELLICRILMDFRNIPNAPEFDGLEVSCMLQYVISVEHGIISSYYDAHHHTLNVIDENDAPILLEVLQTITSGREDYYGKLYRPGTLHRR